MLRRRGNASALLLSAALELRVIEPLYLLRYLRLPAIHMVIREAIPRSRVCRERGHRPAWRRIRQAWARR